MEKAMEYEMRLEHLMPLIQERLAAGQTVRISPMGTSMLPMLRQGIDSVELSPVPERLKKYDLPLYRRRDGHFVLHRITAVDETYTCIGDNQFEFETGLDHDQMLAVVTAFYRGERKWNVTDPVYRCYCRFWDISRSVRQFWRRGKNWLRRHLR